jgi:hypothetical protein
MPKLNENGGVIGKTLDFGDNGVFDIGSAVPSEPPPSYDALIVDYSGNEGSLVPGDMRFVLNTSNVPDGTTVGYTLSGTGITASDFTSGSLTGTATVNSNSALITIYIAADATTEGTETVTITLDSTDSLGNPTGSLSTNTTITDTSKTVAYQIVSITDSTPNEGNDVQIDFRVSNSTDNLYWTINGTTSDFNQVSGTSSFLSTTNIGNDTWYNHSVTFNVTNDQLTEGNEAFTFSVRTGSTSGTVRTTQAFTVQDTSQTVAYSIFSFSDTTPDEDTTVNVEMRVSNFNPTIYWSTNATNDTLPPSSGTASYIGSTIIGSDTYYRYTASFTITADSTTEGNEAYTFYMRTGSTSGTIQAQQAFTIQDTSIDPPSGGGGTPELSGVLLSRSGQYTTSSWEQNISIDLSPYVGSTGRLVFYYESATSFRGDLQLDNINLNGTTHTFSSSSEGFETTTADTNSPGLETTAHYESLTFTAVANGTTGYRWNRDSGGTPSSSTGLTIDASGLTSGFYLYPETSITHPASYWLRSPEVTLTTGTCSISCARYGSNIGTLKVYWYGTPPTPPALYAFTSHTFTNAGKTGNTGPSLSDCTTAYSATTWASNTTYFNMTTTGIQLWTVPETATYRIAAYGAEGGISTANNLGGRGAFIQGDFNLNSGDVLQILVGQKSNTVDRSAGGGGGTFVTKSPASSTSDILVIAGGGGGGGNSGPGVHATTSNSGTSGADNTGTGGTSGSGGSGTSGAWGGAGGGGYFGTGGDAQYSGMIRANTGGKAFINGGNGGVDSGVNYATAGGFGGGGGSSWGSGGGGGYSGGAGDNSIGNAAYGGGGGGSYNNGSNQVNTAGSGHSRTGDGEVTITKL